MRAEGVLGRAARPAPLPFACERVDKLLLPGSRGRSRTRSADDFQRPRRAFARRDQAGRDDGAAPPDSAVAVPAMWRF